jgi:hypothetical protein
VQVLAAGGCWWWSCLLRCQIAKAPLRPKRGKRTQPFMQPAPSSYYCCVAAQTKSQAFTFTPAFFHSRVQQDASPPVYHAIASPKPASPACGGIARICRQHATTLACPH